MSQDEHADAGEDGAAPTLAVAESWFVRRRVADGITLVTEPHVHRYLRCNVWHVEGRDRDLVVDTALGLRPLRAEIDRAGRPLLAVATHAHRDHVGGLAEFDQRAVHGAEAAAIARAGTTSVRTQDFGGAVEPYRRAGYQFGPWLVDAAPHADFDPTRIEVAAAPATRILNEGDVIDLGDRAFEVLHLPGHSPGSIGLWEPATGVLFSGDALYDGPLLDQLDGSDTDDYVRTIERLRQLPVTVVHGGHEDSFGPQRLVALCDAYLSGEPFHL